MFYGNRTQQTKLRVFGWLPIYSYIFQYGGPDSCRIVKNWFDKIIISINFNLTVTFTQVFSNER